MNNSKVLTAINCSDSTLRVDMLDGRFYRFDSMEELQKFFVVLGVLSNGDYAVQEKGAV